MIWKSEVLDVCGRDGKYSVVHFWDGCSIKGISRDLDMNRATVWKVLRLRRKASVHQSNFGARKTRLILHTQRWEPTNVGRFPAPPTLKQSASRSYAATACALQYSS